MPKKSNTLEIIQGIHQAAQNGFDGSLDDDGERKEVGLKRDEGHPILDSRVMDGFSVVMTGDKLCINYQSELVLKDVHKNGFENEINGTINQVAKFLRSEYKKITGNALSLTAVKEKDTDINIQCISRVRCLVYAQKWYTVGGINMDNLGSSNDPSVDPVKSEVKKWYDGLSSPKKPDNMKIAKTANDKEKY